MKNMFIRVFASGLVFLSFFTGYAEAGESKTLAVSCTIPAIPGVNVPLPGAQAPKVTAAEERNQKEQNETKESSPIVVAQQEETISRNEMQNGVLMQTVYSR